MTEASALDRAGAVRAGEELDSAAVTAWLQAQGVELRARGSRHLLPLSDAHLRPRRNGRRRQTKDDRTVHAFELENAMLRF